MTGLGFCGRMSERNSQEDPPVVVTRTRAAGTVTALREKRALEGFVPAIKCSAYCE